MCRFEREKEKTEKKNRIEREERREETRNKSDRRIWLLRACYKFDLGTCGLARQGPWLVGLWRESRTLTYIHRLTQALGD